jgi:hypothetical protein
LNRRCTCDEKPNFYHTTPGDRDRGHGISQLIVTLRSSQEVRLQSNEQAKATLVCVTINERSKEGFSPTTRTYMRHSLLHVTFNYSSGFGTDAALISERDPYFLEHSVTSCYRNSQLTHDLRYADDRAKSIALRKIQRNHHRVAGINM